MTTPDIFTPPEGPPRGQSISTEIFAAMGEEAIFRMCRDFYAELERSTIRGMFPEDMAVASEKLGAFLVGITGGPPRYQERFGNPMMRARHLKFPINQGARDAWLNAFKTVLKDATAQYGFPAEHLPGFVAFLEGFSRWMVNRAG